MLEVAARTNVEETIIKKAWEDPKFKEELSKNPTSVYSKELGKSLPEGLKVQLVQESEKKLFIVIPSGITDVPEAKLHEKSTRAEFEAAMLSAAFKDASAMENLKSDPKAAYEKQLSDIKEGTKLPQDLVIEAVQETDQVLFLRIPPAPAELSGVELSDAELEQVAGGVVAAAVGAASYVVVGVAVAVALLCHPETQMEGADSGVM
jgi:hypothetical protein